jgi:3-oxoacyl-[acyl-carrier-protein] synthase-3
LFENMKIGIVSYGLYLPEGGETAEEIAGKAGLSVAEVVELGIDRKVVPGPDDQPVGMATAAARQAFEKTEDVDPGDVDVVIWTGEEYKDYIAQTASIRLQEETGCHNAWAFDLVGQGVTSILGLRVARDLMIGDSTIDAVLLAGGTRNIDLVDYRNPHTRFLLAASASGAALLLKRDYGRNRLMDAIVAVDPEMADEVYVPGGGTETPFNPDNIESDLMFFQVVRPDAMTTYLQRRWPEAIMDIIKRVAGSGRPDYLALRHLSAGDYQKVIRELQIRPEDALPLNQVGHHGPNDVIISLDLGLKSGAIRDGSSVVMVAAGIGFTYAAARIQWGPRSEPQR